MCEGKSRTSNSNLARSRKGTDRARLRTPRTDLFQSVQSQIPVIEQAIETAAMMLGSDKSRGYCLEMICADFLAGANLDSGQPDVLVKSVTRYYQLLPEEQRRQFVRSAISKT